MKSKTKFQTPAIRFREFKDDWTKGELKQYISHIDSGWSPQCGEKQAANDEWGVLKTTSVAWEGFDQERNKKLPSDLEPRPENEVKADDILITRAGPTNRVGVIAHVVSIRPKLMLSDKLIRLNTKSDVSNKFLSIVLSNKKVQHQIAARASGLATSQTNISQDIIKKLKVLIPSLPEQKKIADFLSAVDRKIQLLKRKKELLEQYKKGLMQKLFSQEIRFKDADGKDFPDWEVQSIGDFTSVTAGGTPDTRKNEYWNGDIRWMNSGELNLKRVYEVENRITELGEKNSSAKLLPKRCVLLGLAGQGKTRGTAAINYVELCCNQSIAAIKPNENTFHSEYLYHQLDYMYEKLRLLSTGEGGRGGLNLGIIKGIKINLPTKKEQERISDIFELFDRKIYDLTDFIGNARTFKKGLLQQLFP